MEGEFYAIAEIRDNVQQIKHENCEQSWILLLVYLLYIFQLGLNKTNWMHYISTFIVRV